MVNRISYLFLATVEHETNAGGGALTDVPAFSDSPSELPNVAEAFRKLRPEVGSFYWLHSLKLIGQFPTRAEAGVGRLYGFEVKWAN